MFERTAGILLHPTSLPGRYGIGDLGNESYNFINFLEAAGQKLWQIFPLGPTGYGDSPYQCFSAFAGNPLLISPQSVAEMGLLSFSDLENTPETSIHKVDFGTIIPYKFSLLKKAYDKFKDWDEHQRREFHSFCEENKEWLDDYALFSATKEYHGGIQWTSWSEDIAFRKKGAVRHWTEKLSANIEYFKFIQYLFFKQWKELKEYANERGIKIIGDMPIFIAYDSADTWANKELFTVNENGHLYAVAGVPPDYFSQTGQLWGNPLYKWDVMEKDDYSWWRQRFTKLLELVDIIRIDHFRGFDAYYEIPGDATTAINGKWRKGPGEKFFSTLEKYMGKLPIIAEDLGVITKSVEKLRDSFDFPGMKILQFAFGKEMENKFLPHNYPKNCIVHTGSHDNDTTRGYFEKARHNGSDIFEFAQKYLNYNGDDICPELIRLAYSSVANLCVIPMQDLLNLGSEARMNFPGTLGGNWSWRFSWDQVPYELAGNLRELCIYYDRPAKPRQEAPELELHD